MSFIFGSMAKHYETWYRMSTAVKLLIILDALALIAILTLLAGTSLIVTNRLFTSIDQDLSHHMSAIQSTLARETDYLEAEARTLANLDGVDEAIQAGDVARLRQLLVPIFITHGLDGVYVMRPDGQVELSLGDDQSDLSSLPEFEKIHNDLANHSQGWATVLNDNLWLTAVAPHADASGNVGHAFVAGRRIDDRYLRLLKSKFGPDITLMYQDRVLASSLPHQAIADAFDNVNQDRQTGFYDAQFTDVRVLNGRYRLVTGYLKLPGTSEITVGLLQPVEIATSLIRHTLGQIALLGILLIGVTLALIHYLVNRVFRPLERLKTAAETMAQGDLASAITVKGTIEVETLASAIDQMRQQLQSLIASQQSWNETLEAEVRARTNELRRLCHQRDRLLIKSISAQEEEQRRIARELHDDTSQVLANFIVTLSAIGRQTNDTQTRKQLARLKGVAVEALENVKRIVLDLRPRLLDDFGLSAAIRWHVEHRLEARGIRATIDEVGGEVDLPSPIQTGIFRIVQEAVNNIVRHADASSAHILINWGNSNLSISVTDDGRGFDVDEVLKESSGISLGLLGMRERAELVGGILTIRSAPSAGTSVLLHVPIHQESELHVENQSIASR